MTTGIPCFIAVCFITLTDIVCICKLKAGGNPASNRFIGAIFPAAFAHFVPLSHFGNSHSIPKKSFSFLLWYGDQWSVIFEKLFVKGRVNPCSKLHCCLILRNCHSHPSLQQPPPDQSAAISVEARPSTSKKTCWSLRWWSAFLRHKVFFN